MVNINIIVVFLFSLFLLYCLFPSFLDFMGTLMLKTILQIYVSLLKLILKGVRLLRKIIEVVTTRLNRIEEGKVRLLRKIINIISRISPARLPPGGKMSEPGNYKKEQWTKSQK